VDRSTLVIFAAAAMSAVGIVGDYFLKRASGEPTPLTTPSFLVGLASEAGGDRRHLLGLHDPDAHRYGLSFLQ